MEASDQSRLDGSGRGVVEESLSNDEARPPEVDSVEGPIGSNDNTSLEGEDSINEEINRANSVLLEPELSSTRISSSSSSSSSSSKASSKDLIEVVTGNDTPSEAKDDDNDAGFTIDVEDSTSPMDIPTIQTMDRSEQYNPDRIPKSVFATSEPDTNWSSLSNESLFSIHPKTNSYGGDHAFLLGAERQSFEDIITSHEMPIDPPQASVAHGDGKNIGEEGRVEEEEKEEGLSQVRIWEILRKAKPPNVAPLHVNPSHHSEGDGSEGSQYSFAFPILVPSTATTSTKGDTLGSRRRQSNGHRLEAEGSITGQPSPSPCKKGICSCFPCLSFSCFARLSCLSRCPHSPCQSCCARLSWCHSCCTRPSCHACRTCPSFHSCCTHLSCRSCCTRPFCASCLSCWPCR